MIQMRNYVGTSVVVLFTVFAFCGLSFAQAENDELTQTILSRDALFWTAYNSCDVEGMRPFFTDDVEFYHDRGGATLGIADLTTKFRKMLDSRQTVNVKREGVKD